MKVRASVKRLCEFCFTVRRRGKLFVYCKKTPRHKQRQWFSSEPAAAVEGQERGAAAAAAECLSCAAPLAPGAPSFAAPPPPPSSLLGAARTAGGRGGVGLGAGGFTLGEVHRQAAMLLGGGGGWAGR